MAETESIAVGTRVRFLEGTFERFEGTVQAIDPARRIAAVAVSIFNREVVVDTPLDQLGPPVRFPEPPPGTNRPFMFWVSNMGGCVLGVSDYHFDCVVYAETEDEARSWGLHVATLYSKRFGFPPHDLRVREDQIDANSWVRWRPEFDPANAEGRIVCNAGELPEVLSN